MELGKTNKSADEIIDILKKEPETKMATGGRAGYYGGGHFCFSLVGFFHNPTLAPPNPT